MWKSYVDLEPIKRLQHRGYELIDKKVYFTVKRDGENVSLYLDENDEVVVASRNQEKATGGQESRMKNTPEFKKVKDLLHYYKYGCNDPITVYGELLMPVSPTRCEPRKKHIHWIMFDIMDKSGEYISYDNVIKIGKMFGIPTAHLLGIYKPKDIDDLFNVVEELKKWCARHHREGVVGKCYENQKFFKEKRIFQVPKKIPREPKEKLPEMPYEKIIRAMQHALDEVGEENWEDVSKAMPCFAKHCALEAKEHNLEIPRNMYYLYVNTSLEKIK